MSIPITVVSGFLGAGKTTSDQSCAGGDKAGSGREGGQSLS